MKSKQLRQKIPFLILFLAMSIVALLYGLFANPNSFDNDFPRFKVIYAGVACTITSLLWFVFGGLDWSTWNAIKKKMGHQVDEAGEDSE